MWVLAGLADPCYNMTTAVFTNDKLEQIDPFSDVLHVKSMRASGENKRV